MGCMGIFLLLFSFFSYAWGIHGIHIHRIYICIGYVSVMYRLCIGYISEQTVSNLKNRIK